LKTEATPKHFAVHSGPELTRHTVNVTASKHDMEDTYLPAFRVTVMDGRAESIMCAYNSVSGQPACANDDLLKTHLRNDWGFKGYVVSDCAAVADVVSGHHYARTIEEGVTASFQAGTDLVCGMPPQARVKFEKDALENAVRQGLLSESVLDQALRRLFSARFRLGLFDPPAMVPWSKITPADNDTQAHRQLALRAARESIVLLKNEKNLLPLDKTYKTIAVIGPNADSVDALVGSYTSFAYKNAKVDKTNVPADGTVTVAVDVTNTGKLAGDEVAQLYLTHTNVPGAPLRALAGFQRVHLKPGEKKTVSFKLENRQLSIVDEAGKRRIVPGSVQLWVGGGQPVARAGLPSPAGVKTQFTITGAATLPD
jgi:beta-glucosidase-like glycosyl hydrolase